MLRKPTVMSAPDSSGGDSEANIHALETLSQLLHRCQSVARMLDVEDDDAKRELIDALAIADLSVLRLLYDEGPGDFVL